MMAVNTNGVIKYSLLKTPTSQIAIGRLLSLLKQIKTRPVDDAINQENEEIEQVSDRIEALTKTEKDHNIAIAVRQYIMKLPFEKRSSIINSSNLNPESAKRLVVKASVYGMTKDLKKAERISKNITSQKLDSAIKKIKRDIAPTILKTDSYKNESRDPVYKKTNINSVNENKNPSAVMGKRHVDFSQSFESDLLKSFSILKRKDKFPLTISSFKKASVPVDPGDLEPTKMIRYSITLQDDNKQSHEVEIDIPEIQPDGTFLVNGNKKYLVYQSVVDPIFFFKPGQAKLQTMYAPVATHWKETKHKSYFQSQIGGYWLPTGLLLSYFMGFSEMCNLFGMKHNIQLSKPIDHKNYVELADGKYLVFEWDGDKKENLILINSFKEINGDLTSEVLTDKKNFKDLIIKQTENRNSIFRIDSVLENIMEPISVEVLKTKMQPITFDGCMIYICKGLVAGRVDDRNDISKQRIRSSYSSNCKTRFKR
jgi:hypothetical protein